MARRKRCVVKRRRKEEGKRRKREEKEEKNGDQVAKKKKKKKRRSPCASFSSAQSSFFGSIRNTLFREKHTISTFVFMQAFFDEQIMWLLRAKNPAPPPFLQYFQNPLAVLRICNRRKLVVKRQLFNLDGKLCLALVIEYINTNLSPSQQPW